MVGKGNNGTTNWRMGCLEKQVYDLDGKVQEILENHLPHINEELGSLKTRISVLATVNIVGIVLALLISKLLK